MQTAPRVIAVPAYLISAILIAFPLMDAAMAVWPPQFGEMVWRFGASGLFTRALMTPLLGLLLASAVAYMLDQRRVLRVFSAVSGFLVLFLVAAATVFALDAVQMRNQVQLEMRSGYDVAALAALTKYGLLTLAALAFAVSCWKASRGSGRGRRSAASTESVLVPHAPATRGTSSPAPWDSDPLDSSTGVTT